jgi:hypothetical protein
MGGAWVVKMVWGVGGWCVVCIRKVVENGVMVVCERTNGQCELRGSTRHGTFCAHKEIGLLGMQLQIGPTF